MAASSARRGIWIGLLAVVVLLVGLVVWFALSARNAVNEMTVARDSLVAARDAVADQLRALTVRLKDRCMKRMKRMKESGTPRDHGTER